jgi:hypothetical protein
VEEEHFFGPGGLFGDEEGRHRIYVGRGNGHSKRVRIVVRDTNVAAPKARAASKNDLAKADIEVYPNPNGGRFTISLNSQGTDPVRLSVSDVTGNELVNKEIPKENGRYETSVDLTGQSQGGTFIVRITQGKESVTKKVIFSR